MMKAPAILYSLFAIASILAPATGCKDKITNNNGNSQIVFPDSNISYRKSVQPLLNISCALSGCHNAESHDDFGYDFQSYDGFMFTPGIVYSGDPSHSKLILSVEGTTVGPMMPSATKQLNANQKKGLRRWITEGATRY